MKIFLQSFFQIGLVAVNTMLISKGLLAGVFVVSFLISLLWAFSKVAISIKKKLIYALALVVAQLGLVFITLLLK
jgi:hypothetical protein